jgi:Na+-transporting NADH:ubiquinone oxidoreductase subunit D
MMETSKNKREPLFSPKNVRLLTQPLNKDNPITIQVLGICSALAVTVKLKPSVVLALSVVFVMAVSNVVTSFLRKTIPPSYQNYCSAHNHCLLVILVDQFLKAFVFDVSKQLSVFVGLIITNCIIMGRLEAFAMQGKPWPSLLDGLGNAAGYGIILLLLAFSENYSAQVLCGITLLCPRLHTMPVILITE